MPSFGASLGKWRGAALVLAFLLSASSSRSAGLCGPEIVCTEWLDQSGRHGARLVIRDDRWTWFDTHAGGGIHCATCAAGGVANGLLRFGLVDPARFGLQIPDSIDGALEPEIVRLNVWTILDGNTRYQYRPVGAAFPISIWGLEGKGRVLAMDAGRWKGHVLAVVVGNEALSVFGAFWTNDGRELSANDVDTPVAIEAYLPAPDSLFFWKPPEPPAPAKFDVDDLRRLLEGGQP
jgi:hypothetical protein